MNLKIKFRESFRPFAPAVLQERAPEWFDLKPGQESPYMLLVAPVLEHRRVPVDAETLRTMQHDPDLRRRVNVVRSEIPAVTHVDFSARLQTVDDGAQPPLLPLARCLRPPDGLPGVGQHQLQRSWRTNCLHPGGCLPLLPCHRAWMPWSLEDVVIAKDAATREAGLEAREAYLAQFQLD